MTRQAEVLTDDSALGGPAVNSLVEALERWNTTRNRPGARGLITILDNASYDEDIIAAIGRIELAENATLAIVAAGWPRRPGGRDRLIGELVPQERRPHIGSSLRAQAGSIWLRGQKRVGKTSLLLYLKRAYLGPRGFVPAYVDFQMLSHVDGPLIFYEVVMDIVNDDQELVIREKTTRILR